MVYLTLFAALAFQGTLCRGALYENVADLTSLNLNFDFIIVGGKAFKVSCNAAAADSTHSAVEKGEQRETLLPIAFPRIPITLF